MLDALPVSVGKDKLPKYASQLRCKTYIYMYTMAYRNIEIKSSKQLTVDIDAKIKVGLSSQSQILIAVRETSLA